MKFNQNKHLKSHIELEKCEFAIIEFENKFQVIKWQNGNFNTLLIARSQPEAQNYFDKAIIQSFY